MEGRICAFCAPRAGGTIVALSIMQTISTVARIAVLALFLSATAQAAGAAKPVVAVIAHNAGTAPTDFLLPFSALAGSGLVDVQAVALTSGPVMLHPSDVAVELPHTIATFDAVYPSGAGHVI